jgi:hypothetical protein
VPIDRVETLKKFIAARPGDPFPRYGLAQEYKNAGRLAEARQEFDALMREHPDYTAAYLHAGNVLVALGERDEARAVMERAWPRACGGATRTRRASWKRRSRTSERSLSRPGRAGTLRCREMSRAPCPKGWNSRSEPPYKGCSPLRSLRRLIVPRHSSVFVTILVFAGGGCSVLAPSSSPPTSETTALTGCPGTAGQPVAPGGYWVHGNTICTETGQEHLFHGVDRPSTEWSSSGQNLSLADFQLMASWKANVVRVTMNQDFWLSGSQYYDPTYAATIDKAVQWAEEAGMDVILDLHWSDKGELGGCDPSKGCQQVMADVNSKTFWSEVAAKYAGDGRVLFELYNEPHDVPWDVWKSGGTAGGFMVVGMQELYDTVRAAGADNLVVIGGLTYAYDLSGVKSHRISGYNIMYATHPYNNGAGAPSGFDAAWGYLTATDPVIATEFGDSNTDPTTGACSSMYENQVITYADNHKASWTGWAWFPGGCSFPSLITGWSGTPSPPGQVVKNALAGYRDPAPGGMRPATSGTDGGAPEVDGSASDGSSQ